MIIIVGVATSREEADEWSNIAKWALVGQRARELGKRTLNDEVWV